MSSFSDRLSNYLGRLQNNRQAALYHVFEDLLTQTGLVSEPEFFLPPNEFDIVGGVANTSSGELVLIAVSEAEEGAMLEFDAIKNANTKAMRFLETCDSFSLLLQTISMSCAMLSFAHRNPWILMPIPC